MNVCSGDKMIKVGWSLKFEEDRLEKQALFKREEQERDLELLKLYAGVSKSGMGSKSLRPKLPKFEEQKDDMDAYIERFA